MPNCRHRHTSIGHGGQMKKKAITSMRVHGQTPAGRLKVLISTGNRQGWFEYDVKVSVLMQSMMNNAFKESEQIELPIAQFL